jgi:hypothetical protein
MGLSFFGRGRERMGVSAGHMAAAALAGGLVGLLAGVIGQPVHAVAPEVVILATLAAVGSAVRANPTGYGRRRQVPRRWIRAYGAPRAYAAWGALLGSGVATVVPHSAYLVLLAAEVVSGPRAGALAGAAFGLTRGLAAVVLALSRRPSAEIADVLPRARALAARGNLAVAAVGGLALLGVTVL